MAVVLIVVVAAYVTWTAQRLDRLHARVDAAWAALDAQLVRRAAAARALVPVLPPGPVAERLRLAATASLVGGPVAREQVENDLSRALRAALPLVPAAEPAVQELQQAVDRVGLARSFHNVAVQDTRAVRLRRVPRAMRLAGRRAMPLPFDIDVDIDINGANSIAAADSGLADADLVDSTHTGDTAHTDRDTPNAGQAPTGSEEVVRTR